MILKNLFSLSIVFLLIFGASSVYADECDQFGVDCAISKFKQGRMQLGLGLAQRQLVFERAQDHSRGYEEGDVSFQLQNDYDVVPVIGYSFPDAFFENTKLGYSFGYRFVRSKVDKQLISRNGDERVADLDTSASLNILGLTGSAFYIYTYPDNPSITLRPGAGISVMYSRIRGKAYKTELDTDSSCDEAGKAYVEKTGSADAIKDSCELTRFDDRYLGAGAKLYVQARWQQWESEFSLVTYQQLGQDDYRSKTRELMLTFSRFLDF